jgi:hypothetical protein
MKAMIMLSMSTIYICAFSLKYYTYIVVSIKLNRLSDPKFWSKVESLSPTDITGQTDVYDTFYWLNDGSFRTMMVFEKMCGAKNYFSLISRQVLLVNAGSIQSR